MPLFSDINWAFFPPITIFLQILVLSSVISFFELNFVSLLLTIYFGFFGMFPVLLLKMLEVNSESGLSGAHCVSCPVYTAEGSGETFERFVWKESHFN